MPRWWIPIVTVGGTDPVQAGLIASFNRPGGNITGASFVATELETKRKELLRDLVPAAAVIGILINVTNPAAECRSKDLQIALHITEVSDEDTVRAGTHRFSRLGATASDCGAGGTIA